MCGITGSDAEHQELLAEFVRSGLARGERVCCFPDAAGPDDLLDALGRADVAVGDAIAGGRLAVVPAADAYLREGPFDPDTMIRSLHAMVDDALAAGFSGLRLAGEMSWAAGRDVPLAGYEARVEQVYAVRRATGLCVYDRRRFGGDALAELRELHRHVVPAPRVSGNGLLRIHRLAGDGSAATWLRIAGEADIAGSDVLADALADLDGSREIHLDVARLRFMDLAGLRPVAALARDQRVVLHHPARTVRRLIELVGSGVEEAP